VHECQVFVSCCALNARRGSTRGAAQLTTAQHSSAQLSTAQQSSGKRSTAQPRGCRAQKELKRFNSPLRTWPCLMEPTASPADAFERLGPW